MMNCREVTASGSDYLDRKVGPGRRLRIVLHLAMCAGCRAYMRQLRMAIRGLQSLRKPPAGESPVDEDLLSKFREANPRRDD